MIRDIALKIKDSPYVAAALDEVTDNSTNNFMGVLVFTLDDEFVRHAW